MSEDVRKTTVTGKCGLNQTLENCHSLVVDIIEAIAEITSSGRKITNFKLELDHIPIDDSEAPKKITGTVYKGDDGTDVYILDSVEEKLSEIKKMKEEEENGE